MQKNFSSIMQKLGTVCSKLFMMLIFAASFGAFFIFGDVMPDRLVEDNPFVFIFLCFGIVALVCNIGYFAWQILLVHQYKTYEDPGDDALPTVAVLVPAYNEGKQVADTLQSLLKSDYPGEKLEIVTVNDGSRDDTWRWMTKIAGGKTRITAIDLPKNSGKRNALYKGLLVTKAEVVVTLDSDSVVPAGTLRQLVAPFAYDRKIGCVAGNIRVLNPRAGLIPRMLDVSFVFGFEFLKSAQSVVRTVLCSPGALSAYRRSALLPYMTEWVNETFFGRPAVIGEDRALTNILIREGWEIVFQKDAVAYSEMPTAYSQLCKMMIRWTRANVRENFAMFKFAFTQLNFQQDDLIGLRVNLVVQTFWQISPVVFSVFTLWSIFTGSFAFIFSAAFSILFWSTLPAFIYARRYSRMESLLGYVYGFFSFATLFWVAPYSVLTVHRSGWMTRQVDLAAGSGNQDNTAAGGQQ